MKSLGIKYQLRLTTLVPVFLIALLFAVFYNGQLNKDLEQHMSRYGEAYIRQLLPAVQFAMMRHDARALQGLINASTVNSEVKMLAFYDTQGKLLAYRGGKHAVQGSFSPPEFTGDYIETRQEKPYTISFLAPVTLPRFNLYSSQSMADDRLGWLALEIDTQSMLIKRYQMYIVTIFITLLGLLMSLSIHFFLSKRIYIPIAHLRRSMKQILRNEFETHIRVTSSGELGDIEKGCVHLQSQYLNTIKDLNHHVEVATADLQHGLEVLEEKNIELSMEKKKYEEKWRQKSEFIANISHEIRNPMNGLIGFTNVLLESKLDSLQMDYVKTIKTSAQDLLTVINDILDFSKMDAGKLFLDCIPFDIRAAVDEVVSLLGPIAHRKGLDLIVIHEPNLPRMILGDPVRVKQILSNLISNALKFTEFGHVLVRTQAEEAGKDYILNFSVADTGIGIPAEDHPKLFNAFTQVDVTITRRFGGSGLGLVICKQLAEQMRGKIWFTSELHQGTTFFVQVKLEKLAAYEAEKEQFLVHSPLDILYYDEEPLYLEATEKALGACGINCICVDNFQTFKKAYLHTEWSLIFIGVSNPNDFKLVSLLESKPSHFIFLLKAWKDSPSSWGEKSVLIKPISHQKLFDVIENVDKTFFQKSSSQLLSLRENIRAMQPKILIAEDNPLNQLLLHSFLKDRATVKMVYNGQDAVTAANLESYDAILLDLQMPQLNGLEAAGLIRKANKGFNHSTPILLISADSEILPHQLKQAGIEFYLTKPIEEEQFLNVLINIIRVERRSPINWALCLKKVSGNQVLAEAYLVRFIEELRENRCSILELFNSKNQAALEKIIHKLYGACCFCGVPSLQQSVNQFNHKLQNLSSFLNIQDELNDLIRCIDEVIGDFELRYQYMLQDPIEVL